MNSQRMLHVETVQQQAPQPPPDLGSARKAKPLACARCRHRKQKCTEVRPCENCIQSSAECVPSQPNTAPKPPLEPDYVQRLEERIAQLESLIPQESLDHISASAPRAVSASNGGQLRSRDDHIFNITKAQKYSQVATALPAYSHPVDRHDHEPASRAMFAATDVAALNPISPAMLSPLPGIKVQRPTTDDSYASLQALGIDLRMEHFLIQTYFDMAHSQYPFLLKHEFLQWVESWRMPKDGEHDAERWKAFFVCMVHSVALLMTKARLSGPAKSHKLYTVAVTNYLPDVVSLRSPIIRAQAFLLLTLHALHTPSLESIISLSSWTIRFCVMAKLHVAESEPFPTDNQAQIHIQHRRRIFWCAYAADRAVCSSYDLPFSIADNQITVPVFENIDDSQLNGASPVSTSSLQAPAATTPTSLCSALHVLASRRLESEIQETVLGRDFVTQSDEAFIWRSEMLEKVKEWNRESSTLTQLSQKGYASLGWLRMIYFYNIVMLYRPMRMTAHGVAGDWSVQACCQALLLFRRLQMNREIAQPWLGLLTQFQMGVILLYCFFATPRSRWKASYKSVDVSDAIRACASTLAILAERWTEAECVRDVFETLAREVPLGETWDRPVRMSDAGRASIEENWGSMSSCVVHAPTLQLVREMAADKFVEDDEIHMNGHLYTSAAQTPDLSISLPDDIDLDWVGQADESSLAGVSSFDPYFSLTT